MKKRLQSPRAKRYRKNRARREAKKRKRAAGNGSAQRRLHRGSRGHKFRQSDALIKVTAPAQFSFVRNPEETIGFFSRLRDAYVRAKRVKTVFIDLEGVEDMTAEVIVVLLSRIRNPSFNRGAASRGNVPKSSVARDMLAESGFYFHVDSSSKVKPPRHGRITRRDGDLVDSEESDGLITEVAETLPMDKAQEDGIQATAIECMTNTKEHASGSKNRRKTTWWFSAYCNPETKKAQFAFVDLGIGIFRSLERRGEQWLKKIGIGVSLESRSDLLRALLSGRSREDQSNSRRRSRTGIQYRGKGLPNMAKRNRLGHTRRLVIVSNDIYADVERDEYRQLEQEFSGTIICWEHWPTSTHTQTGKNDGDIH